MATATAANDIAADASATAVVGSKRKHADEPPTAPVPDAMTLPLACIMRVVKSKLPDGVFVGQETKRAFGKACSLFILYLTTMCAVFLPPAPCALLILPLPCKRSAADISKESGRTTVAASDVLGALRDLEFDDFLPSVEAALAAFRESEKVRSIEAAAKRAAQAHRDGEGDDEEGEEQDRADEDGDDHEDES